jgi:cytochrome c oxidase subunit IV
MIEKTKLAYKLPIKGFIALLIILGTMNFIMDIFNIFRNVTTFVIFMLMLYFLGCITHVMHNMYIKVVSNEKH